jgi:HSP20 family protein
MMQLFDPFDALMPLREAMNHLFEESFIGPRFEFVTRKSFPINVYEMPDQKQLVVEAAVPGVKPEQIHVQVEGDVLTIRASQKQEQATEKGAYVRREITQSEMCRAITLPASVNVEAIEATYEHGVLMLRMPKVAAAQPKQIPINVKELTPA